MYTQDINIEPISTLREPQSDTTMTSDPDPDMERSIPLTITQRNPTHKINSDHRGSVLLKVKRTPSTASKKIRLCLLNVRSLGDDVKSGKIRTFIENDEPTMDGALFVETWLKSDHTSSQQIVDITPPPGYEFHHRARQGRWGGGVGALIRSGLKTKMLPLSKFDSFEYMNLSIEVSTTTIH